MNSNSNPSLFFLNQTKVIDKTSEQKILLEKTIETERKQLTSFDHKSDKDHEKIKISLKENLVLLSKLLSESKQVHDWCHAIKLNQEALIYAKELKNNNEEVSNLFYSNAHIYLKLARTAESNYFIITYFNNLYEACKQAIDYHPAEDYLKFRSDTAHELFLTLTLLVNVSFNFENIMSMMQGYNLLITMLTETHQTNLINNKMMSSMTLIYKKLIILYLEKGQMKEAFDEMEKIIGRFPDMKFDLEKQYLMSAERFVNSIEKTDPKKALLCYEHLIDFNKRNGTLIDESYHSYCYAGIASVYYKEMAQKRSSEKDSVTLQELCGFYYTAIEYYEKALKFQSNARSSQIHMLINVFLNQGTLFEKIYKTTENDTDFLKKAEQSFLNALMHAKSIKSEQRELGHVQAQMAASWQMFNREYYNKNPAEILEQMRNGVKDILEGTFTEMEQLDSEKYRDFKEEYEKIISLTKNGEGKLHALISLKRKIVHFGTQEKRKELEYPQKRFFDQPKEEPLAKKPSHTIHSRFSL